MSTPQTAAKKDGQSTGLALATGSAQAHKLNYDQRARADALLDEILADPEKFAFEVIALRCLLFKVLETQPLTESARKDIAAALMVAP